MIQIAADLAKLYTSFMEQKGVETDQRQNMVSPLLVLKICAHSAHSRALLPYTDGAGDVKSDITEHDNST